LATAFDNAATVEGFSRNVLPGSIKPRRTALSSVWDDLDGYRTSQLGARQIEGVADTAQLPPIGHRCRLWVPIPPQQPHDQRDDEDYRK
jgi:hypothetical protein